MSSSYETSSFTGTNGRVVVHHWLPAERPRGVVVLVHGLGEHAGRYQHVAEHLNDAGLVLVGPDHAGHGLSAGERGVVLDVEDLATDLGAVVDRTAEEHPGLPIAVLGHSLGGVISARALQRGLVRPDAWVLSGPVVGGNPDLLALVDADPLPDVPIDPAVLSRDPKVGAAYARDPLVHHGALDRRTLVALRDAVDAVAAAEPLGAVPTLHLHGEDDVLAPYGVSKAAVEGLGLSTLEQEVYPGARHEILNETNRDEVLADVSRFLGRVLR